MKPYKWDDEKIRDLEYDYYNCTNLAELAEKYKTSRGALKRLCQRHGFKRNPELYQKVDNRLYRLKPLLADTILNWYWYGFIIGDGSFRGNELLIGLQYRDHEHLMKFATLVNRNLIINIEKNKSTLTVGDCENIPSLKDKLGILNDHKTIHPVEIKIPENKDLFFAYFVGLVDADGCIEISKTKKAKQLKIELHPSWFDNLFRISNFIKEYLGIESKVSINGRGYAILKITGHKNILNIKNKAVSLQIDYLERKWVDISNQTSGCDVYRLNEQRIIDLFKSGHNLHQISRILGINYNTLNNHKKELIQ